MGRVQQPEMTHAPHWVLHLVTLLLLVGFALMLAAST